MNIFFLLLTLSVFSFFIYSVGKTWVRITSIGTGAEEIRTYNVGKRLWDVFFEGLMQRRMYKDFLAGFMHLLIFWGFFVVSVGTLETLTNGIFPSFTFRELLGHESFLYKLFVVSQDWTNTLVVLAIVWAVSRRLFFPPKRFESLAKSSRIDAYIVLGLIGGLVLTSLMYWGAESFANSKGNSYLVLAPLFAQTISFGASSQDDWHTVANLIWMAHIAVLFGFMCFLPYSKHQHLMWVWPNIFFKSHKSTGRIRPMKFAEDAESFGVGSVKDFTWKELLDGMVCVECGRCTSVCPASNTGKTLNPRLIINDIKEAMHDSIANPEDKRKKLIGEIVTPEELWACTTCGACMEACPLHIEHIPAIIDMRRYMTMTEGTVPPELQTALSNLENQSNPWGFNNQTRADWAKGLDVKTMAETNGEVEYLFWVGCAGSFDERYKKVSRAIVKIMNEANTSFAILGTEETCNGDTARRAGNEYLADMQIKSNVETFKKYKVKKVVTACPHCFNTIKNEYPDFGFEAEEILHHSELISKLSAEGKVKPVKKLDQPIAYHDSCYLGRHNKIFDAPRRILESVSSQNLREMPRNRKNGFCCGAGGARMWMEETQGERVNVNRAKEAIATGAKTIATACPFCMTMMRDGVAAENKDKDVDVLDIAELVAN